MSHGDPIVFTIFLIFTGAALLATGALLARQALLVAYVLLGIILGPSLLNIVPATIVVRDIAHVGIVFLLFLLGLNLHPQKLGKLLREAALVTLTSSAVFAGIGILTGRLLGLPWLDSLVIGAAAMASSTIIGLKLLPTTVLHHQRMGEVMISILLLQDVIAIVILLLKAQGTGGDPWQSLAMLLVAFPGLILAAWLLSRALLFPLIRRFDTIQEYVFLLSIGWCLGIAELGSIVGLSLEIGAFVAGVALAASPVSTFIAESLKPLRDFFLILFFFAIGADLHLPTVAAVIWPSLVFAGVLLVMKPLVFATLFRLSGEQPGRAVELGFRLGQLSEFSLLIAVLAQQLGVIGATATYLIQASTVLSFLLSPYLVVLRYPTPIAVNDRLRRN